MRYLMLFLLLYIGACQPNKTSEQQDAKERLLAVQPEEHCATPTSGTPVGLVEQYLEAANAIKTDPAQAKNFDGMVLIKGGAFQMGGNNDQARPDEFPNHPTQVNSFWMDAHEVTNAEFQTFVDATGYTTVAEIELDMEEIMKQLPPGTPAPNPEDLQPFSLVFHMPEGKKSAYGPNDWWQMTKGANWQHPQGKESSIKDKGDYPVVHISWYDAQAYCKWSGKRLPTEAEWEYAGRGGGKEGVYPWGNESVQAVNANFWQGTFPVENTGSDGYIGLAPVGKFAANSYGLYDMAGNVWEWCSDWYHHDYYKLKLDEQCIDNPKGPTRSYDPMEPSVPKKVVRGGSFLCNDSYCSGYRVAARMKSSPDTGLEHTGCRCVRDAD